jgi:hypothetical protein
MDLMKWGPTSANSTPARFLLLRKKVQRSGCARRSHPAMSKNDVESIIVQAMTQGGRF